MKMRTSSGIRATEERVKTKGEDSQRRVFVSTTSTFKFRDKY